VNRKIKRHIFVPTGTGSPELGGTPGSLGGVWGWPVALHQVDLWNTRLSSRAQLMRAGLAIRAWLDRRQIRFAGGIFRAVRHHRVS